MRGILGSVSRPIRVVINSRCRVASDDLDDEEMSEVRRHFTHSNSRYWSALRAGASRYALKARGDEPEIKTWEERDGRLELPRGGYLKLKRLAEAWSRPLRVRDDRSEGMLPKLEWPSVAEGYRPRDYQEDMIAAVLRRTSGILKAATGAGKTCAGIAAAQRAGLPAIFVVWESGLFDQWIAKLSDMLGLRECDVGIVRGKERRLRTATVAMQQTLSKLDPRSEVYKAFGFVLCDEIQRTPAVTMRSAIDPFVAKYRIGVSADVARKDKLEALTYELFGDVIYESDNSKLEEQGMVLPVDIEVIPTDFRADWYVPSGGDPGEGTDDDYNRLLAEMSACPKRNELAAAEAEKVGRTGEAVFVMARRRDHCHALDAKITTAGVPSGLMIGGDDYARVYDETRAALVGGHVNVAIGTIQSIGQGIDVPRVGTVVLAAPAAANRQMFNQARGRACRPYPGRKRGRVIYLWDRHVFPWHLKNLVAWYPGQVKVRTSSGLVPAERYAGRGKSRGEDDAGGLFQ